jgi:hypothetical protein
VTRSVEQGWWTCGTRVQKGMQKGFLGMQHSLLYQFFFFYFFCPSSVSVLWENMWMYAYIWLVRDYIWITAAVKSYCEWNIFAHSRECWEVLTVCFAWAWQWMGKYMTLDKTLYSPFSKPLRQACQWEPDEHPLPIIMAVAVFFFNDNWIVSSRSFCSHCFVVLWVKS